MNISSHYCNYFQLMKCMFGGRLSKDKTIAAKIAALTIATFVVCCNVCSTLNDNKLIIYLTLFWP